MLSAICFGSFLTFSSCRPIRHQTKRMTFRSILHPPVTRPVSPGHGPLQDGNSLQCLVLMAGYAKANEPMQRKPLTALHATQLVLLPDTRFPPRELEQVSRRRSLPRAIHGERFSCGGRFHVAVAWMFCMGKGVKVARVG